MKLIAMPTRPSATSTHPPSVNMSTGVSLDLSEKTEALIKARSAFSSDSNGWHKHKYNSDTANRLQATTAEQA
eukprot:4115412-Amphidinium_carterae.1